MNISKIFSSLQRDVISWEGGRGGLGDLTWFETIWPFLKANFKYVPDFWLKIGRKSEMIQERLESGMSGGKLGGISHSPVESEGWRIFKQFFVCPSSSMTYCKKNLNWVAKLWPGSTLLVRFLSVRLFYFFAQPFLGGTKWENDECIIWYWLEQAADIGLEKKLETEEKSNYMCSASDPKLWSNKIRTGLRVLWVWSHPN